MFCQEMLSQLPKANNKHNILSIMQYLNFYQNIKKITF